jgi:hypothetical protein
MRFAQQPPQNNRTLDCWINAFNIQSVTFGFKLTNLNLGWHFSLIPLINDWR